jgi:hypothetical protein
MGPESRGKGADRSKAASDRGTVKTKETLTKKEMEAWMRAATATQGTTRQGSMVGSVGSCLRAATVAGGGVRKKPAGKSGYGRDEGVEVPSMLL